MEVENFLLTKIKAIALPLPLLFVFKGYQG